MNKQLKFMISILLTAVILYFLLRNINISQLKEISRNGIIAVGLSLIIFFFIKLINTFRYARLYNIRPGLPLFSLLSYSNMTLSIFPFRVGEVFYVHGFKKHFDKDYKEGVSKLLFLRFIDYILVYFLLLFFGIYVYQTVGADIIKKISLIFVVLLILSLGFFCFLLLGRFPHKIKVRRLKKLVNMTEEGIKTIKEMSLKSLFIIIFLTAIYWILRLVMGYIILSLLGLNLSFIFVSFISLCLLFIGMLPVKTVLDFGIFEGGWAFFLVNAGFDYEKVVPLIIQYHLTLLLPSIIFGVVGYLVLLLLNSNDRHKLNHQNNPLT